MATRGNYIAGSTLPAVAKSLVDSNQWNIMADAFEEYASSVQLGMESAEICRLYANIENLRRCGMPIPQEDALRYADLNAMYSLNDTVSLEYEGRIAAEYSGRVGPFYTAISCGLSLVNNWKWIEDEPVRHLTMTRLTAVEDLGLVLRNQRMQKFSSIHLKFNYRVNPSHVADLVRQMTSTWLNCFEFKIDGVEDRLKLIRSAFDSLRANPTRGFLRGAKLFVNGRA